MKAREDRSFYKHNSITRFVLVFALFMLMFAAFPERPKAADSTVYLGNVALKNDNAWHSYNTADDTISGWKAGQYKLSTDSSTLTIKGLNFSNNLMNTNALFSKKPLKIAVIGTNTISCTGTGSSGITIYNGSSDFGDLDLSSGDGSLSTLNVQGKVTAIYAGRCVVSNVKLNATSNEDSSGVFCSGDLNMKSGTIEATNLSAGNINVVSGATIRVQDYIVTNDDSGISVISGGIVTSDGGATFRNLNVSGGSLSAANLLCFYGLNQTGGTISTNKGDIDINSGNYTGSGGSLISSKTIYVYDGDMQVKGAYVRASSGNVDVAGNLKVTAGSLNVDKYGIKVGKDLTISTGGTINTTMIEQDDPDIYIPEAALYVEGKMVSDGGRIVAVSESGEKEALRVSGETVINGGNVSTTFNNTDSDYFGTTFSGPVYLQGGKLTVETNGKDGAAVYCRDKMQVNNNAILEVSSNGGGSALHVYDGFTLNSGTVTLDSKQSTALFAKEVTMKGGKLTMSGKNSTWFINNSLDLAGDIWMSEPSNGTISNASNYYNIRTANGISATHAVLQKVSSIAVQGSQSNDLYEGDCFEPADPLINVTFADGSEAPLSYKTHSDMFSFSPSLTQGLKGGTNHFDVTCLTKTASFDVEATAVETPVLSGRASATDHAIQWNRTTGAGYYEIYGKKDGESYSQLSIAYPIATAYRNTNISIGEKWEYYVVPVRRTNQGVMYKGTASNHVVLTSALEPPVIRVSGSSYDSVSLSWDKVAGASSYKVYKFCPGSTTVAHPATSESYTDKYVETGREYTYYVKAVAADGSTSDSSNVVKVTPTFTGKTTLSVSNNGKYELSWAAVDGATGYEMWRGNGSDGSRSLLVSTDADTTSFTDDTADIYTVYNYTVVPVRTSVVGIFKGEESNVAVTKASVKPAPDPEPEPEIVPPSKEEPSGTKFNLLQARSGKVTKTSIQIKWKKVAGAKKYVIFGNKCGIKTKYKKLTTTTRTSLNFKKVAGKKVKKGTYFKFLVYAVDSKGKVIAVSKTVHVATKGGKVGNDKSVKIPAKNKNITLKKGMSIKLNAKAVPESKKLVVKRHRSMAYESSNKKVATVTSKGVIKAKGKGVCYVYAYTQNGVFARAKVTVK